jgi:hypothetical protein
MKYTEFIKAVEKQLEEAKKTLHQKGDEKQLEEAKKTLHQKGDEYATEKDMFSNFRRAAAMTGDANAEPTSS